MMNVIKLYLLLHTLIVNSYWLLPCLCEHKNGPCKIKNGPQLHPKLPTDFQYISITVK